MFCLFYVMCVMCKVIRIGCHFLLFLSFFADFVLLAFVVNCYYYLVDFLLSFVMCLVACFFFMIFNDFLWQIDYITLHLDCSFFSPNSL